MNMKNFKIFAMLIICTWGIGNAQNMAEENSAVYVARSGHDVSAADKVAEFIAFVSVPENAEILSQCTCKGHDLWGKVKVVNSFPDIKVQVVNSFPDIKVQVVDSFPDKCGKWKFVDSFPDFKIQFVDSFPDLKIQFVNSFPGI